MHRVKACHKSLGKLKPFVKDGIYMVKLAIIKPMKNSQGHNSINQYKTKTYYLFTTINFS